MKKITFLSLILVFMISSSVQASEWAYSFVVWDGKKYEVKEDVLIDESEIGKSIGKVKTQPYYSSDYTDKKKYYGNASNVYPIGTQYNEIKGIPTSDAITIKDDKYWVKAVYVEKAPFHLINILNSPFFIFTIVIITLILIGVIFRTKKLRTQK